MHDVALRTGADPTAAKTLAEAITHHISPKIDRKHGPLPQLIQWGSLMDVTYPSTLEIGQIIEPSFAATDPGPLAAQVFRLSQGFIGEMAREFPATCLFSMSWAATILASLLGLAKPTPR